MTAMVAVESELLALDLPSRPYPGLRPFEMSEWAIFFGRELMIDEVIDLLGSRRVVVVHGSSGSGKSSLIRAGVLPRLARQHRRGRIPWLTCAMRPSGGPLWNLASALAALETGRPDIEVSDAIRREFDRPGARLTDIVAGRPALAHKRVCILIDQFEEIFRYSREVSREEVEALIDLLRSVVDDGKSEPFLHVLITMRSEFLGDCARVPDLAQVINRAQYLLPPMDHNSLMRAILRPAELYGATVDDVLAERLIAEGARLQDTLPLIQHALMLLWHRAMHRESRATPEADVSSIRLGVDQYVNEGGLAKMLSDHADRVMQNVVEGDRPGERVVEMLFRALTDINAEGHGVRNRQSFRRLCANTGSDPVTLLRMIDNFRADGNSFLTPYPPAPIGLDTVVDMSHEALIRSWTRISDPKTKSGWLETEFRDGQDWRILRSRSLPGEEVLLPPAVVPERERWLASLNPEWSERYGGGWADVQRLIQLSRAASDWARKIKQYGMVAGAIVIASVVAMLGHFAIGAQDQVSQAEERALVAEDQASKAKERALVAEAANLWQPLQADRKDMQALLAVAQASLALRRQFMLEMVGEPKFAAQFAEGSSIARALIGLSASRRDLLVTTLLDAKIPEEASPSVIAALARAALESQTPELLLRSLELSKETPNSLALKLIGEATANFASDMPPGQSKQTMQMSLEAIQRTTDASALGALAKGIAALGPTPNQVAQVMRRLVEALHTTTDLSTFRFLTESIAALAPYMNSDQASEALQGMIVALQSAGTRFANSSFLTVFAALAPRLTQDQVSQTVVTIIRSLERTADGTVLLSVTEGITAVAGRLTSNQAENVMQSLIEALPRTHDQFAIVRLSNSIAAVALRLNFAQTDRAALSILSALERRTDAYQLGALAYGLAALRPTSGGASNLCIRTTPRKLSGASSRSCRGRAVHPN